MDRDGSGRAPRTGPVLPKGGGRQRPGRRWHVTGQVQGVGFRPFVYRAATRLGLAGHVANHGGGVTIQAFGDEQTLDRLADVLLTEHPPLAQIDTISAAELDADATDAAFHIIDSAADEHPRADVTVDTALCDDCRRELFDPADPRHRYGLINCTHCGPRYSIIRGVPYDRPNTTMADFTMCPTCAGEYADPLDRRFHAQPTACPDCGPRIELVDPTGNPINGDAYQAAAALLAAGRIVGIKGLGGYHLAVRADDAQAVERLRQAKRRDAKPFAVMVRDIDQARRLVELSPRAIAQMRSPACPIVLAPRRGGEAIADAVAPANHRLGVMLAYTPMQHLLFAVPQPRLGPLVMTSANVSDEPLVIDNDEALRRLGGMCDALLWHDRPIQRAVEDSVLIDVRDQPPLPVRRARGYAPRAIDLPIACDQPGLCVGGELKNTIALVREGQAILSPHIGDLAHPLAYAHFRRTVDDMCKLFGVAPRWIAHDLHPVYMSTRFALRYADERGIEALGVQHHYTHAAALIAEHRLTTPLLGIVCDGVGYGDDHTIWGGELLLADLHGYRRLAHLRPLRLPGGDAAARETRRCGLALLHQAFGDGFADHPAAAALVPDPHERTLLATMMRHNVNCTTSSAAGRVFDGVAALLGLVQRNRFEAQAGLTLEAAASRARTTEAGQSLCHILPGADGVSRIDLSPLVRRLVARVESGDPVEALAALFHQQLAAALADAAAVAMAAHDIHHVGLTGGVFCNQQLAEALTARLQSRGATVLRHTLVPPGDGGLALGQAAHCAATRGGAPCV